MKRCCLFLAAVLLLVLFPLGTVAEKAFVRLWVKGEFREPEVSPFIESNRTYVPLRFIGEALNLSVNWDPDRRSAIISNDRSIFVEIFVDETTAYVNHAPVSLDAPARIYQNRTFVPLRFIGESLLQKVDWDPQNRCAIVGEGYPYGSTVNNSKDSTTQPGLPTLDLSGTYESFHRETYLLYNEPRAMDVHSTVILTRLDGDRYRLLRNDESLDGKNGVTTVAYATYYPQGGYLEIESSYAVTGFYGVFHSEFVQPGTEGGYGEGILWIGPVAYGHVEG